MTNKRRVWRRSVVVSQMPDTVIATGPIYRQRQVRYQFSMSNRRATCISYNGACCGRFLRLQSDTKVESQAERRQQRRCGNRQTMRRGMGVRDVRSETAAGRPAGVQSEVGPRAVDSRRGSVLSCSLVRPVGRSPVYAK